MNCFMNLLKIMHEYRAIFLYRATCTTCTARVGCNCCSMAYDTLHGLNRVIDVCAVVCGCRCNQANHILLQLLAQLDKLSQLINELKYGNDQDLSQPNVANAVLNTELLLKVHLEK